MRSDIVCVQYIIFQMNGQCHHFKKTSITHLTETNKILCDLNYISSTSACKHLLYIFIAMSKNNPPSIALNKYNTE